MLRIANVMCVAAALAALSTTLLAQNAAPPAAPTNVPPTPSAPRTDKKPDVDMVESGQKIFQTNCSFCHGANAKGGESGPDLLRSVIVLDDEAGNKIGVVIHEGRPDKGMPKFPLTDEQIADISAFLHDRIHAAAERGSYQILNIVTGDAAKGEAYFKGSGGCTSCHSVTGDLAHIGSKMDPVSVQQHIVMPREFRWGPRAASAPPPSKRQTVTVTVTQPNGEISSGKLTQFDDFTVALITDEGEYRSFTRNGDTPKVEVHDPLKAHSDMLLKYTDAVIHNLTAYLVSVK
ncbi:MAG TPA: c-type cytochrome [Bryobacteraceae bacterium]|jgi:mono/diheme cytochrome c family protein|nr:c-type cytochrome [Bryobacteraceae bacterium]